MTLVGVPGRRLEWDSAFFGFQVAQGEPRTPEEVAEIDRWARREGIRCVYLLVSAADIDATRMAERMGFNLTGVRVACTRETSLVPWVPTGSDAALVRPADPSDLAQLQRIAASSHSDSRFYADPLFPRDACNRLYEAWIRRSCEGWADEVLVADREGPCGYISLHRRADAEGAIGLFAVAPEARRSGIGRALVQGALAWFDERRLRRVTVVTQGGNLAALRMYQTAGFDIARLDLWLHKWHEPDAR